MEPLTVAAPVKSALRLTAVNDAAARLGLKPGIAVADARAMYPALVVAEADPQADQRLLEAVADWCDRYTPMVGLDRPDGLVLDVTGCAHLFGGEAALCRDLIRRLAAQGLRARAAVADTVGCAWGVARLGRVPIVPVGATRETMAPLPLAALRIHPDTVAALAGVGLKCVADVLDRPRAPLAARFGIDLIRRIDQALGREDESIAPRRPPPVYVAERRFADPIALEADVLATVERLARQLALSLERHGEGARMLRLTLFRADGKVQHLSAATSRPVRAPDVVRRLFVERLAAVGEACDPGFGFDIVRLAADVTEPLDPVESGFGVPDHAAEFARLVDRLGARFGLDSVRRMVPHDTHIPEFAAVDVPAHVAGETSSGEVRACAAPAGVPDSLAPARPIHLLERPEPIKAIAEVPDGPPVRFRWRFVMHEIAVAEGPERIAPEWWRDGVGRTLTRDYFRVETRDGARFWLYREGLYGKGAAHPSWFLHGLFA
ncbi:MAG TPA: DNA polymerase Y family protein [Xanthobacteraceae bacterium]|jgi:protein ImuB|nr:DNA polymerase Y family protein [Xanthobacteraceae bacterium]